MKLPRGLSGQELVRALCRVWGYKRVHQEGSHAILETDVPGHHRIAIPLHKDLRVGTLNAVLKAVARHKGVNREQLLNSL